jgi:hypothetical protein
MSIIKSLRAKAMHLLDRERAWVRSLKPLKRYNAVAAYWALVLWCVAAGISALRHWQGDAYFAYVESEDSYVNFEGSADIAILTSILIALVIVTDSYTYYETVDSVAVWEAKKSFEGSLDYEADSQEIEKRRRHDEIEKRRRDLDSIDLRIDTIAGTSIPRLFTLSLPLFLSVIPSGGEDEIDYVGSVAMTPEALIGYLLLFVVYYERIDYNVRVFLVVVLTSFYVRSLLT